ncbi:cytochrome c [Mesorhizobium sp. CO1-1-8]|nr:cytochrome c [Mesorhizobium sp. CO1-1-8]MBZ9776852.1 cytochrome c [Mesorhizobium sp. CO1-1-8]
MSDQPRFDPLAAAATFPDGASARQPVPGTVRRDADISPTPSDIPQKIDMALLQRGRERFEIFCSPCHGLSGDGQGMIVQRGFPSPPTYHQDALRQVSNRHIYDVITHGYGVMYSYADRVPPADRWAIVAYVRALQLSQHAKLADLPMSLREKMEGSATQ